MKKNVKEMKKTCRLVAKAEKGRKDKFGRIWKLSKNELCFKCGQPDSCGDCNHKKISKQGVLQLGGYLK